MPDLIGHPARPPLRFLAQGWAGSSFSRVFGYDFPFLLPFAAASNSRARGRPSPRASRSARTVAGGLASTAGGAAVSARHARPSLFVMPGPDRASLPLRPAALNPLITSTIPERESSKFADSLSGYHLSINHLAAAR
jgi:hypothetical protein